jgi:hypothetical protein
MWFQSRANSYEKSIMNKFLPIFICFPVLIVLHHCFISLLSNPCYSQHHIFAYSGFKLEASSLPQLLTDHRVGALRYINKFAVIYLVSFIRYVLLFVELHDLLMEIGYIVFHAFRPSLQLAIHIFRSTEEPYAPSPRSLSHRGVYTY